MSLAAELAVEHRAAGDDDRRQVAARRAHQQRRRGLVAAAQQHHAVDRIGADRFLDVHADEVAEQHRGRAASWSRPATSPEIRAGSRRPRRRRASRARRCWRKCALQGVSSDQVLQMPITGRPSNRSCGQALVLHPGAVNEAVAVGLAEPLGAAELLAGVSVVGQGRLLVLRRASPIDSAPRLRFQCRHHSDRTGAHKAGRSISGARGS